MTVMQKTFNLTLDVENQLENTVFSVSQNDFNSVELVVTLTQDGGDFDLTGSTPRVAIKKPSGMYIFQDGTVTNATSGQFTVVLDTQAYTEVGNHYAEVYLYKTEGSTNKVAVTGSFTYASRSALLNDSSLASNNDFQSINNSLQGYQQKPLVQAGAPTVVPSYTGQTSYDTTNKLWYIASNNTATTDWQPVYAQTINWGNIAGTLANQTDLQNALNTYMPLAGGTITGTTYVAENPFFYKHTANNKSIKLTSDANNAYIEAGDSGMTTGMPLTIAGGQLTTLSLVTIQATTMNVTGAIEEAGTSLVNKYQPKYVTGTSAPASAPTMLGQLYVDTTNKHSYVAVGTSAVGDWHKTDPLDLTSGGTINGSTYVESGLLSVQNSANNKAIKMTSTSGVNFIQSCDHALGTAMNMTISGASASAIPDLEIIATVANIQGTLKQNGNPVLQESPTAGTGTVASVWTGTSAQYTALATKDANTLYVIVG